MARSPGSLINSPLRAIQGGAKAGVSSGDRDVMDVLLLRFTVPPDVGSSTLPLLAYQGAWIQDPATQQLHRHWSVSKQTAIGLLDYFEQPPLRSLSHPFLHQRRVVCPGDNSETQSSLNALTLNRLGDLRQVFK